MAILVTGGAGYIGSHTVLALLDKGADVVVLDNLSTGSRRLLDSRARFTEGDVGDVELVKNLIAQHAVRAVVHCAGSIVVPESVANPLTYYDNNVVQSRNLIAACIQSNLRHFVFSSTASVYGTTELGHASESDVANPSNPYARSKLMTEWMLEDASKAHDFRYMALRYFNVAGADPAGRSGQVHPLATHLIKQCCRVALGKSSVLRIFGTDYPTKDGTGVRDYIHVSDLADIHLRALEALQSGSSSQIYNCGYGTGFSVREIANTMGVVSGKLIPVSIEGRRTGDLASVVANPQKLQADFSWEPRHADIRAILKSALDWEKKDSLGHASNWGALPLEVCIRDPGPVDPPNQSRGSPCPPSPTACTASKPAHRKGDSQSLRGFGQSGLALATTTRIKQRTGEAGVSAAA